jgi:hypothetical protein
MRMPSWQVSVSTATTALLMGPVAARESPPRVKSGYAPVNKLPDLAVAMIEEFLDAPMPETSEKESIPTSLLKEKQR